jgi:hypothetical protein
MRLLRSRNEIGDGRQVGQHLRACRSGHRQRTQLAAPDVFIDAGMVSKALIFAPADQFGCPGQRRRLGKDHGRDPGRGQVFASSRVSSGSSYFVDLFARKGTPPPAYTISLSAGVMPMARVGRR